MEVEVEMKMDVKMDVKMDMKMDMKMEKQVGAAVLTCMFLAVSAESMYSVDPSIINSVATTGLLSKSFDSRLSARPPSFHLRRRPANRSQAMHTREQNTDTDADSDSAVSLPQEEEALVYVADEHKAFHDVDGRRIDGLVEKGQRHDVGAVPRADDDLLAGGGKGGNVCA